MGVFLTKEQGLLNHVVLKKKKSFVVLTQNLHDIGTEMSRFIHSEF